MAEPSPLVDAAWLAAHRGDPRVRIADVRWTLKNGPSAAAYAQGHVPGAVFVDLGKDLAAPPAPPGLGPDGGHPHAPGRHPLPSPGDFAGFLARLGVERDTLIVAYDDAGGSIAARLWWLLRWFGHGGGRILDGGLAAWLAAGQPLSTDVPIVAPSAPLSPAPPLARAVDKAEVDRLRSLPGVTLLDARATERFEGRLEPVDARPGHIPGARSAPFAENLVAGGGAFRPPAELAARYRALGALEAQTVVCYCGSGVTACHDLLALVLAGRDDALLYEGSWSDWAADPSLPAALGG
jgi:thiosulfate/3-mercaptopyruvate sulfurtransferase